MVLHIVLKWKAITIYYTARYSHHHRHHNVTFIVSVVFFYNIMLKFLSHTVEKKCLSVVLIALHFHVLYKTQLVNFFEHCDHFIWLLLLFPHRLMNRKEGTSGWGQSKVEPNQLLQPILQKQSWARAIRVSELWTIFKEFLFFLMMMSRSYHTRCKSISIQHPAQRISNRGTTLVWTESRAVIGKLNWRDGILLIELAAREERIC